MGYQGRFSITLLFTFFISVYAGAAEFVSGEYVLKLKKNSSLRSFSAQNLSQALGVEVKALVSQKSRQVLVTQSLLLRSEAVLEELSNHPLVEKVEPNYIYRASLTPNDTELDDLWGLINKSKNAGGVDIDAELAWKITTGSRDVVVAVIDSGINYRHRDLQNNMWVNELEAQGTAGVDDDGNGYVDDIYGYDFFNKDADPMDDNGHGSHCAGTIGAEGNNGYGVVGVNWQVRLMALKFLSRTGSGTLAGALGAIEYAIDKKVDIMSNSWGGGGESALLLEAIEEAEQAGILFVAAAGNDRSDNDRQPTYPASYAVANVISVASIDDRGNLSSFSNYGRQSVHVAAPGDNILSTHRTGFRRLSGTSMATPHVAGIAALLLADDASLNSADLKERILETSVPRSSLTQRLQYGVVNAHNALTNSN